MLDAAASGAASTIADRERQRHRTDRRQASRPDGRHVRLRRTNNHGLPAGGDWRMSRPNPERAFLGVGWSFPVCQSGGRIQTSVYEKDIRESIRIILGTNPGERLMRPEFGAGLRDFVFESLSSETIERVRARVHDSLVLWEFRIDVNSVTVTVDQSEPNKLLIEMKYAVRATNTQHNLVYPFYLEEGSAQ
jgi:phage baseplate assembly protein W